MDTFMFTWILSRYTAQPSLCMAQMSELLSEKSSQIGGPNGEAQPEDKCYVGK